MNTIESFPVFEAETPKRRSKRSKWLKVTDGWPNNARCVLCESPDFTPNMVVGYYMKSFCVWQSYPGNIKMVVTRWRELPKSPPSYEGK